MMVASIPFWLWLSKRYSKHQAIAFAAVSIGAITVPVNGMAADVIDIDEARIRAAIQRRSERLA